MDKTVTIAVVVGVYAVVMLIIGLVNKKNSDSMTQFTVGSRNAGAWVSAMSYGTAYFSAVMFVGYAGKTGWGFGAWAVAAGIGNALIGSLLAWLVLANRTRDVTRRLKIKSMPQFFNARFKSEPMKLFAVAVIFVFLLPYSASVYKGLTSVCSVLLGIDETLCMILIAVASAVIIVLGGYIAQLKADFVQGIVMIFGVSLLIIFVIKSNAVGGLTTGLTRLGGVTEQLGLTGKHHISLWATVLMTSFGTWGLPQMIHKYYGIKDKSEVVKGTVISTLFSLLIAGGGYFIGSFGHVFFSELPEGGVDYIIPNMLINANLPNILLGVVLVLLISASVSTLSSITITACTTLTMDLVKGHINKDISQKAQAALTKVLCIVFIALSYVIANSDTPILDMMSYSWGIISGSFLAPYLISLYWRGLNKAGAWAGMLGGFAVAAQPVVAKLFIPSMQVPFGLGNMMDNGSLYACFAMVLSLILCVVVSLATGGNSERSKAKYAHFYDSNISEDNTVSSAAADAVSPVEAAN
ncbi:MAG: sodium:solute symporter family protein [Oscillospiraceae bacterium]|nr:sodium:solute symporter family protein [Oscillospiraceae bacterium]